MEDVKNNSFRIVIGDHMGSMHAGNMFNRFSHMLNDAHKVTVRSIFDAAKSVYNHVIEPCVLYETPLSGRAANITIGARFYKENIHFAQFGDVNSISIKDVYVGYDYKYDRLYLKANGKILRAISDNMLSELNVNPISQFMRCVSNAYDSVPCFGVYKIRSFFEDQRHTLQIRNNKTILMPETWRLFVDDFDANSTYEIFLLELYDFIKIYKVPQYVYYCRSDLKLLIDLKNDYCKKYIHSLLKKKKCPIVLSQPEFDEINHLLLCNNNNHYFSEFVVPFYYNQKYDYNSVPHQHISIDANIEPDRLCIGDKHWVYFKLYTNAEMADEILTDYLIAFVDCLTESNVIQKFFFIKYTDPYFHIRLRFKAKDANKVYEVIRSFHDWFEVLRHDGLSFNYQVDAYQREYGRYGGYLLIDAAETVFYADSLAVLYMKTFKQYNNEDEEMLILRLLYDIINTFVANVDEQLNFFEVTDVKQNQYRDEYKKNRKNYISLFNEAPINDDKFMDVCEFRKESLLSYAKNVLSELHKKNEVYDIVGSLCHMFCNRYMCDNLLEQKYMCFLRHALYEHHSMMRHRSLQ